MQIDPFKALLQQGATGRISADADTNQLGSASQRLGGKTIGVVKDFFARFSSAGRAAQQTENQTVNNKLRQALVLTYGDRVPAKMLEKLENNPSKPITVSDVKKLIDQIETARPTAMTITMPGTGAPLALSPQTFPRAVLSEVPNLQQEVQQKVDRGHDLVASLLDGTRGTNPAATVKDVTDIAWFLHLSAESKIGAQFKAGALTTVDGQQRLRQFLDSCPESYQRISSHIEGFKQSDGGQHRGIDIPKGQGIDSLLPHGRTTILYASMIPNATTPLPEPMLFFKLESHGCRLATPKAAERDAGHQDRGIRLGHDISNFLGHTFSFLSGIKARATGDHGAESRKERLPGDIKTAFKDLVENAPPGLRDTLMRNDPLGTAGGIRVMMANIAEARQIQGANLAERGMFEINLDSGVHTPVYDPALHQGTDFSAVTTLETLVTNRYGGGPELDYRIGNEVILLPGDLG